MGWGAAFALLALLLVSPSCTLDFGSAPVFPDTEADVADADGVDPDGIVDVPAEIPDDATPPALPCEPVYDWQEEQVIVFTELDDGAYHTDDHGDASAQVAVEEVAGEPALVVHGDKLDIYVHDVGFHGDSRWQVRFYLPAGSVAEVWPVYASSEDGGDGSRGVAFMVSTVDGLEAASLGVYGDDAETDVGAGNLDLADRWIDLEIDTHADRGLVTARFSAGEWGEDDRVEHLLTVEEADIWSIAHEGQARFVAGGSMGTGEGIAWSQAVRWHADSLVPTDDEACHLCEWHRVSTGNPDFSESQCTCLEAATPEGTWSSDYDSTYCTADENGDQTCWWAAGAEETQAYSCAPVANVGDGTCHQWQPIADWTCDLEVPAGWEECVATGCHMAPDGHGVGVAHCVLEPISDGEDVCACLLDANAGEEPPILCDPSDAGTFVSDGLACGRCEELSPGCGFAFLAPCQSGDPCDPATCDPVDGCVAAEPQTVVACDDGDPFTVGDACQDGACVGTAIECDDVPCAIEVGDCGETTIMLALPTPMEAMVLLYVWGRWPTRMYAVGSNHTVQKVTQPGTSVSEVPWPEYMGGVAFGYGDFTGNDIGELVVATSHGLFHTSAYDPGGWYHNAVPGVDWAGWEGEILGLWAGSGLQGAPMVALGAHDFVLTRPPNGSWASWTIESILPPGGSNSLYLDAITGSGIDHLVAKGYKAGPEIGEIPVVYTNDPSLKSDLSPGWSEITGDVFEAVGGTKDATWFRALWMSDDHQVFVIATPGKLARFVPDSNGGGAWTSMMLPTLDEWGQWAISGRGTGELLELVVAGPGGALSTYDASSNTWTPVVTPDPSLAPWSDVHMTPDGSFVAVGHPGAGGPNGENYYQHLVSGACGLGCSMSPSDPVGEGCLIGGEDSEDGCVGIWAPAGALCDDLDEETHHDRCVGLPGQEKTLCMGTFAGCEEIGANLTGDTCVTGAVSDGLQCVVETLGGGSDCDDGIDGTLDDFCQKLWPGKVSCLGFGG